MKTVIPEYLKAIGFKELTDIILATGDQEGSALVDHERLAIESSGCTICRQTTASKLLRKWIVKNNCEPNRNG